MNKILLSLVLVFVGCVSAADKILIQNGSAVGQGNLREWDTLTPAEQREDHFNLVGGYVVLDHNVNGTPIPPAFVAFVGSE